MEAAKPWTQNGVLCPKSDIHVPPARDYTSFFFFFFFQVNLSQDGWCHERGGGKKKQQNKWRCWNFNFLTSFEKIVNSSFFFFFFVLRQKWLGDRRHSGMCPKRWHSLIHTCFLSVLLCAFRIRLREWRGILRQSSPDGFYPFYCAMTFYLLCYCIYFFFTQYPYKHVHIFFLPLKLPHLKYCFRITVMFVESGSTLRSLLNIKVYTKMLVWSNVIK